MFLGAATLALNSKLVSNLLKNLKARKHLKSHEDKTPPKTLSDLTLAINLGNNTDNADDFFGLLLAQQTLPFQTLFLVDQEPSALESWQHFQIQKIPNSKIVASAAKPQLYSQKSWALQQLLNQVETEFVLFLDTNVRLSHPRSLFSLYEECSSLRKGRYSFASVFPRNKNLDMVSVLSNQVFVNLYYFLPNHWTSSKLKTMSAGNEEVMFANAQRLKNYNFLTKVSHSTNYGAKLAQLFKAKEGHSEFFDGGAFFQSNYYSTINSAILNLSKMSLESKNSRTLTLIYAAIVFWAFVLPFVFIPFAILNPCWIAALLVIIWGQYRLMQELDLSPAFLISTPMTASLYALMQLWGITQSPDQKKLLGRFLGA